ncbi:MAG: hypothetical protein ABIG94_12870 [Pseudomonadota bacterium]
MAKEDSPEVSVSDNPQKKTTLIHDACRHKGRWDIAKNTYRKSISSFTYTTASFWCITSATSSHAEIIPIDSPLLFALN